MQEAWVSSRARPIRRRRHGYIWVCASHLFRRGSHVFGTTPGHSDGERALVKQVALEGGGDCRRGQTVTLTTYELEAQNSNSRTTYKPQPQNS
eukprot:5216198-Pyramimonas_sp.AAC.1